MELRWQFVSYLDIAVFTFWSFLCFFNLLDFDIEFTYVTIKIVPLIPSE